MNCPYCKGTQVIKKGLRQKKRRKAAIRRRK